MAYDEDLANRIRALMGSERGVEEKRMFGGLAFLINGNMSVAASGRGGIMVRVPPDETESLLTREHVEPMVMAGRETRGWLRVARRGRADQAPTTVVGGPRCRLRQGPAAEVGGVCPVTMGYANRRWAKWSDWCVASSTREA